MSYSTLQNKADMHVCFSFESVISKLDLLPVEGAKVFNIGPT
jgi:hypothetical protein